MFLQFLKIFLKNKKTILHKKTKYSEFIQNELLYYIFSYFLDDNFFSDFGNLIKCVSFYKKNIFFLFQEFRQTSNFISMNQLKKKKYMSNNFSKSFFFYSQFMLISKIRNLIIRKINPVLCACVQFEHLFKKKTRFNFIFSNKRFLCNFCVYKRTGNIYKFKKAHTVIKKIENYTCFPTLNSVKKKYETIIGKFLMIVSQLKINFQNEWNFRIHRITHSINFENLFEKKFIHFQNFLVSLEIKMRKSAHTMCISFKLDKIYTYLITSDNKHYIVTKQLSDALAILCLYKKLKLGYFTWKVQKNIKKNQILFIMKQFFRKEIRYKIKKKLTLKKCATNKNFKQSHTNICRQVYIFSCLKIFINKLWDKKACQNEQMLNTVQQLCMKKKNLKNVFLFLKEFSSIRKIKINHSTIKKFNLCLSDVMVMKKNDLSVKFIKNENYRKNDTIKKFTINRIFNLFKFLFQKNNQSEKDMPSNLEKTGQLEISKFKLLCLFIFMFKKRKFHFILTSVKYDIVFTIFMFFRKKNCLKNKLYIKFAKEIPKNIHMQKNFVYMSRFLFSKENLYISKKIKTLILYKFRSICIKKRYFFNISIIEILLQNLFKLHRTSFKIILEYLKNFSQLKINCMLVLKDPSYIKIKKIFVNKISKSNTKFKFCCQSELKKI